MKPFAGEETGYRGRDVLKLVIFVSLFLFCFLITVYFHFFIHVDILYTHFFYVPILVAGFWWRRRAVWVALCLGLWLTGTHFLSGIHLPVLPDLVRSGLFLVAGAVVSSLRERSVKTEQALNKTKEYLNNLIEYSSSPIIVWDDQGRITLFNIAFQDLTGYKEDKVMGQRLEILFPEESREEALKEIDRALKGEYWKAVEIPVRREDGRVALCLWNSANIYDTDGAGGWKLASTIAQGQDITARKKADEEREKLIGELKEALSRIKALQGLLPICAYCKKIRDDQGSWNQLEVYITGHSKAQFSHSICPDCAKQHFPEFT